MTKKEKKIIKIASPMQQYLVLYKRREIRNQFTCNIQESRMHVSDVSGYFAKKNLQISSRLHLRSYQFEDLQS